MELVTAIDPDMTHAPASAAGFADWVGPHIAAMRRLVARIAPDVDADDAVQEALLRAWRRRSTFDARRGTPATWLLAIAADQARQARRRSRPSSLLGDVAARVRSADDSVDVESAVSSLPARQRLAVDCFYFVGLNVNETAAVMGCSEGTVKSTLSDARKRLRPMLEVRDA